MSEQLYNTVLCHKKYIDDRRNERTQTPQRDFNSFNKLKNNFQLAQY